MFAHWRHLDWEDKHVDEPGTMQDIFRKEVIFGEEAEDQDSFSVLLDCHSWDYYGNNCYMAFF